MSYFVFQLVSLLFWIYTMMIFGRLLGSWFPKLHGHPIMRFLIRCTDPYLNVFKRFIPPIGMIDLSPMVALFALYFIQSFVTALLAKIL